MASIKDIKFRITGLEDLKAKLKKLEKKSAKKIIRTAVKEGSKILWRTMQNKQRAQWSRTLFKSLFSKVKSYRQGSVMVAVVGPRTKFIRYMTVARTKRGKLKRKLGKTESLGARKMWAGKYAHLVEFGHKKGKGRSAAKAYPFVRPAMRAAQPAVTAKMRAVLERELAKEAASK